MAGQTPLRVLNHWWVSFRSLVRWNEWAGSKLPLVFAACYYSALAKPQLGIHAMTEMVGLVWVIALNASFGFAVNSYSDRLIDVTAGKPNALAGMTDRRALGIVSCFPVLALISVVYLYRDQYVLFLLICLSFFMAWAYSVWPLRLKERDILGVVAASIAQRVLPVMIVFQGMGLWNLASLSICILSFLIGLRYIFVHQIIDMESDLMCGVSTMATKRGRKLMTYFLTYFLIPAEVLTLLVAVFHIAAEVPAIIIMFGVYLLYFGLQWFVSDRDRVKRFSALSYWLFSEFYNVVLPTFLSIYLIVMLGTAFWPVVLFTFLWLNRGIRKQLKRLIETIVETATCMRRKSQPER